MITLFVRFWEFFIGPFIYVNSYQESLYSYVHRQELVNSHLEINMYLQFSVIVSLSTSTPDSMHYTDDVDSYTNACLLAANTDVETYLFDLQNAEKMLKYDHP